MKFFKTFAYLFIFLIGFALIPGPVEAYEYPVSDLGNCRDRKECQLYCELPQNHAACWSYSVYGPRVLAGETAETKITELGITFPVAELGNCVSVTACKAYCSVTQNSEACRAYGENHGLTKKERILEKAAVELGCNSLEECKTFCALETNRVTCQNFAKRYRLKTEVQDKMMETAKNELGCKTYEECRQFCAEVVNRSHCEAFTRRTRATDSRREELIRQAKTELGCTSFLDCRQFCQNPENFEKCRNFGQAVSQGAKTQVNQTLLEKLGCTTAEECRRVCADAPDKCPNFPKRGENLQKLEYRKPYLSPSFSPKPILPDPSDYPLRQLQDVNQ